MCRHKEEIPPPPAGTQGEKERKEREASRHLFLFPFSRRLCTNPPPPLPTHSTEEAPDTRDGARPQRRREGLSFFFLLPLYRFQISSQFSFSPAIVQGRRNARPPQLDPTEAKYNAHAWRHFFASSLYPLPEDIALQLVGERRKEKFILAPGRPPRTCMSDQTDIDMKSARAKRTLLRSVSFFFASALASTNFCGH